MFAIALETSAGSGIFTSDCAALDAVAVLSAIDISLSSVVSLASP
jgi:hypothetical protein